PGPRSGECWNRGDGLGAPRTGGQSVGRPQQRVAPLRGLCGQLQRDGQGSDLGKCLSSKEKTTEVVLYFTNDK
ncbi:unnamed protein product, partial [Amoebophrya sp. A120]